MKGRPIVRVDEARSAPDPVPFQAPSQAPSEALAGALQAAVAEEIREVRRLLDDLAEVLIGDDHFATNYIEQLQVFDLLAQYADETASVLDRLAGGDHPHAAVAPVRLGVVRDRLAAALLSGPA